MKSGPLCGARLVVVQAHLKSGGGELTRENVRLMGGAVAALRREQCSIAEEEAAAAVAVAVGEAAEEALEKAASLVAKVSVLDDQSVRLTTHLPAHLPAARGGIAQEIGISHTEQSGDVNPDPEQPGIGISHPEQPGDVNLDPEQPGVRISHLEQPGLGQAWLLALGDFNLDPAQVLDEVRAAGLHGFGCGLGRQVRHLVCMHICICICVCICVRVHVRMEVQCASIHVYRAGGH